MILDQVEGTLKAVGASAVFAVFIYVVAWFKKVSDQKQRNAVNEIDLSFKKIDLDNHSKPIDDLLANSNKSHGANGLVDDTGDQSKKK